MDKSKQSSTNEARNLARASADAAANEAEDAVEARAEIIEAVNEMEKQAASGSTGVAGGINGGLSSTITQNEEMSSSGPVAGAMNAASTATETAPSATQPAPKKKTGKIIAIIILGVLLLGGIGAAVWYFAFYNQPEKMALDAIVGALNAENVSEESVATIVAGDNYSTLSVNSVSSRSGATQLDVTFEDSSFSDYGLEPISVSLQLQQNRLFLQTDGVDDYLTLALYALLGGYSTDYSTGLSDSEEVATDESTTEDESTVENNSTDEVYDYYELDEDMMVDSTTGVDGTWWMVDISEVAEYFGGDAEAVTCLVQSLTTGELNDDLAKSYQAHPFLAAASYDNGQTLSVNKTGQVLSAESGQQLIEVSIDNAAMAEFLYDYYNNSLAGMVESCVGAELEQMTMSDIEEAVEKVVGSGPSIIVLKISTFGHQLLGVYSKAEVASSTGLYGDSSTVTMITEMSYPAVVNIAEPTEYEDVLDSLKSLGIGSDDLKTLEETYLPGGLEV